MAQRLKHLPGMRDTRVRSLGQGRSPGERNGNPLQYSCLENPMEGGAWWATVHGVAKSQTRLSDFTYSLTLLCIRIYTLEKEDCSSRRAGYFLTEKDHGLLGSK